MKKIFLMIFLSLMILQVIQASSIAVVVKDSSSLSEEHEIPLLSLLHGEGYSATLIDKYNYEDHDLSNFNLILIAGRPGNVYSYEHLDSFVSEIDVKNLPVLAIDQRYVKDFGWTKGGAGTVYSNQIQKIYIEPNTHPISEEFEGNIIVHIETSKTIINLEKDETNFECISKLNEINGNGIICAGNVGTILSDESILNKRNVFFGISFPLYWTQETEQLFKNSIVWLMEGQYPKPECNTEILEDYEETCELSSEFDFSVIDENNLNCEINGNEIKYKSFQDYYGEASCLIRVEDNGGYEIFSFEVNIVPVNDAPVITDYFPKQESLKIIENKSKEFKIEAYDIDSVFEINWFVDDVGVCSGESYSFNKEKGNYSIKAILSDGEFYLNKLWDVFVGSSSEFTCSEIGGNICSENQFCPGEIIDVKDTNNCCSVNCVEKPLEFSDAKQCFNKSDLIEIEIKEPDDGDDFEIGEIIEVEVKIKNKFDEKLDFEIEVHLYDLDEDESIEDVEEEIKIKSGKSETIEFEIEIPEDIEDNDFVIYVFVEDEEERCNSEYVEIDIERKKHDVIIQDIEMPETVYQGENMEVRVEIKNIGESDEDVYIEIENSELSILEKTEEFEIEEYGDDDEITKTFYIDIPESAEEKDYEIKATVIFDDYEDSKTESFSVLKKLEEEKDFSKIIVQSNEIIKLGEEEESKREVISLGSIEKSEVEDLEIKIKFEEEIKEKPKIKKTDFWDFSFCDFNSPCKYPPCVNHIVLFFILLGGIIMTSICIILIKRKKR